MANFYELPAEITSIQQMTAWASLENAQLIEADSKRLKAVLEGVVEACKQFEIARQTASVDSNLSQAGVDAAKRRAGEVGAEKVKALCDRLLAELLTRAGNLSGALTNSLKANTDANVTPLLIERRSLLAAMDPVLVQSIYAQACIESNDELTAIAIESAPAFMRLVTAEDLEKGKVTRAAFANPDAAKELEQVRFQYSVLSTSRNSALMQMIGTDGLLEERARSQIPVDIDADETEV